MLKDLDIIRHASPSSTDTRSGSEHYVSEPCQSGHDLGRVGQQCAGCGSHIVDRYYLMAVDRPWHSSCLRCHECCTLLDGDLTCFTRDGNIYCKHDYHRLFSVGKCDRCCGRISSTELVMRARERVYHIHCFTCVTCSVALAKGDQFGMRDGLVYCRHHYELMMTSSFDGGPVTSDFLPFSPNEQLPYIPPVNVGQKGRPRKRKLHDDLNALGIGPGLQDYQADLVGMDRMGYDSPGGGHSQRSKRMRTSFKHHQLRTMKSYFALNQNPDAKDLKQLAQKTGLSKRVLQVWFQNARAKWRRTMVRQEKSDGSSGSSVVKDSAVNSDTGDSRSLSGEGVDTPNSMVMYSDMLA